MDVVLRTPHGDGEITLVVDSSTVTLGDVVERVVGRAPPPVVYVDGRAASSNTLLADADVLIGSSIDTDDAAFRSADDALVQLSQLAGQGCGTIAPLRPGDYRIGPGRRVHADELTMAPVEDAVMDLRVSETGEVKLRDRGGVELIGGPAPSSDRFVEWGDEPLSIDGRIFQLIRSSATAPASVDPDPWEQRRPTSAGTITFHRPIDTPTPERSATLRTPTDALALARARSTELWQRRGTGPGELQIPVGLHVADAASRHPGDRADSRRAPNGSNGSAHLQELQPVRAPLDPGRGIAFVGRGDFTRSAAYGMLVMAVTLYGPADLDVVVSTTPERAEGWEWVKWLPHARVGGRPDVMTDDQQLRNWLHRRRAQWTTPPTTPFGPRRTLMVVDDENAWHERANPLREIVADDRSPISFVVLTTHLHDVPTLCETVVSERSHGTAHVDLRHRRRRFDDVHAFIVTADLAGEVARHLAPLDDAAIITPTPDATVDPMSFGDLHQLGPEPRATIAQRWSAETRESAAGGLEMRLGKGDGGVVSIDLASDGPHLVALTADDDTDPTHAAVLDAGLLGLCVDHPPDELEIVALFGGAARSPLARLPHVSASLARLDEPRLHRAVSSLLAERRRRVAVLEDAGVENIDALSARGERTALRRLVVVADRLDIGVSGALDHLRPLLEVGGDVGIHVLVRTSDPADLDSEVAPLFGATIDAHASGTTDRLDATVAANARTSLSIGRSTPIDVDLPAMTTTNRTPSTAALVDNAGLAIEPFVIARDLTPMEKRLVRDDSLAIPLATPSDAVIALLDAFDAEAGARPRSGPPTIAPELPDHIDLIDFLHSHPGDGVPFAMADRPDAQRHEPVWWMPGTDSSIVVYGVARSRVSALIPTLSIGASTRLTTSDVRFHIICPEAATLAALAELPQTATVTAARARGPMTELVDRLGDEVDRRLRLIRPDHRADRVAADETSVVIMIDDVGGCRRLLDGDTRDLWGEIEQLVIRGQPVGVSAVLVARRTDDMSAQLAATISTHLVGQLAANDPDHRVGPRATSSRPVGPGRVRRASDGVDLQFATVSADLDSVIVDHQLSVRRGIDRAGGDSR